MRHSLSAPQFSAQGFAVFENALTAADLTTLRNPCETLLNEPVNDGGDGRHKIGLGQARRFLAHRHEEFPDLAALILGPKLRALAEACRGQPVYLFYEQFVVKGPGNGASFVRA